SVLILTTTAPAGNSSISSFVFLGVMVLVFYFLILRPQRSRMKAQQQLASSLEVGDRVQTIGGMQGVIRSIDDDSVVIEVEQGKIRLTRRAIASKLDKT
ncbi:MAG: preprotein translocase subunit YajC, partial [Acidimicrobiia bacterium]